MKREPPIIGTFNEKTGDVYTYPSVPVRVTKSHYLRCRVCGEMLDKRDLRKLLAHEEECSTDPAPQSDPTRAGH